MDSHTGTLGEKHTGLQRTSASIFLCIFLVPSFGQRASASIFLCIFLVPSFGLRR